MGEYLIESHSLAGIYLYKFIDETLGCPAQLHLVWERVIAHPDFVVSDIGIVLFVLERQSSDHQSIRNHSVTPHVNLIGVADSIYYLGCDVIGRATNCPASLML